MKFKSETFCRDIDFDEWTWRILNECNSAFKYIIDSNLDEPVMGEIYNVHCMIEEYLKVAHSESSDEGYQLVKKCFNLTDQDYYWDSKFETKYKDIIAAVEKYDETKGHLSDNGNDFIKNECMNNMNENDERYDRLFIRNLPKNSKEKGRALRRIGQDLFKKLAGKTFKEASGKFHFKELNKLGSISANKVHMKFYSINYPFKNESGKVETIKLSLILRYKKESGVNNSQDSFYFSITDFKENDDPSYENDALVYILQNLYIENPFDSNSIIFDQGTGPTKFNKNK
jgi:hypothetical protein